MSLVRTVAGLLFSDDFDRDDEDLVDSNDWEGSTVLELVSNEIKSDPLNTAGFSHCLVEQATVSQSGEMVVQARLYMTGGIGFTPPRPGLTLAAQLARTQCFGVEISRASDVTPTLQLYRTTTGLPIVVLVEMTDLSIAIETFYTVKMHVKDSFQKVWFDTVEKAAATYAGNDAFTWSPGISRNVGGGSQPGTFAKYDDFFAYSSNIVTVTGLASGYKAQVGTVTAVEAAGTAAVDIAGQTCPIQRIKILTGSGVLVESIIPVGGVFGGDTWAFTEPWVQDAEPVGSWVQD